MGSRPPSASGPHRSFHFHSHTPMKLTLITGGNSTITLPLTADTGLNQSTEGGGGAVRAVHEAGAGEPLHLQTIGNTDFVTFFFDTDPPHIIVDLCNMPRVAAPKRAKAPKAPKALVDEANGEVKAETKSPKKKKETAEGEEPKPKPTKKKAAASPTKKRPREEGEEAPLAPK